MQTDEQLVALFVGELNRRGLEPLFAHDVPAHLRTSSVNDLADMSYWEIRHSDGASCIDDLERRAGRRFPKTFRPLLTQFQFAEFEAGSVMFFANTGRQDVANDISGAMFADKNLYPVLVERGLLQFGRAAGGSYDPVCFATHAAEVNDAPIVRVDHEEVLMRNRIRIVENIAPSFKSFVEIFLQGG